MKLQDLSSRHFATSWFKVQKMVRYFHSMERSRPGLDGSQFFSDGSAGVDHTLVRMG